VSIALPSLAKDVADHCLARSAANAWTNQTASNKPTNGRYNYMDDGL